MMHQEPEMIYRKAQRETMTSYAPPMHRRVDSDRRTSLGWWGAISELAGFALLEYLASPVVGIAVLVVSFCLDVFAAMSGLFRRGANALDGKKRKTQK
jgi:hypothetical protein